MLWLSAVASVWLQNLGFHERSCLVSSGMANPCMGALLLVENFYGHFLQSWDIYNSSFSHGFQSL